MTNLKAAVLAIGFITTMVSRPVPKQVPQQEKTYILRLKATAVGVVLNALSERPLKEVGGAYSDILSQVQQQDAIENSLQQPKKDSTAKQNKKQ